MRFSIAGLWLASLVAFSQTRGIVPEEFVTARPGPPAAARPSYRKAGSSSIRPVSSFAQVGLTVWRLRPANREDSPVRLLVHEQDGKKEWIPERVDSSTILTLGDRVRLDLELPREGYLYVIDREDYGGGRFGEPVLIFPTLRTRGGVNRVEPGRLIDIPSQTDSPNYLTVQKSRPSQQGELLTILVTPQPLEGIEIKHEAQRLDGKLLADWERRWGQSSDRFELNGGVGRPWTLAEQRAGLGSGLRLTPSDPPPQTVFRTSAAANLPLIVSIPLHYAQAK